jgi:transcriptional regulator with XRE-family HTH domain
MATPGIVARVVTRKPKPPKALPRRLFLKEHREAKGVSAGDMAERFGIERESVYRLEREPWRVNSEKQAQWAMALQIEPEDLWRPPGPPSLDGLLSSQPEDVREMVRDIVVRMLGGGRRM